MRIAISGGRAGSHRLAILRRGRRRPAAGRLRHVSRSGRILDRNWDPSPVRLRDIDVVLLTHAHVDHCGLVPKLVQDGLSRPDHHHVRLGRPGRAGAPRRGRDSSGRRGLQGEAAPQGRPRGRTSRSSRSTRSTTWSARCRCWKPCPTTGRVRINGHVQAVFHDAGHILGSAMIELRVNGARPAAADRLHRRPRPVRTGRSSATRPSSPRPITSSWNRPTATATTRTTAARVATGRR